MHPNSFVTLKLYRTAINLKQFGFGTRMNRIERIDADFYIINPPNPRLQRSINQSSAFINLPSAFSLLTECEGQFLISQKKGVVGA